MENNKKLKMLQDLTEKQLTQKILIPLFQNMGFKDMRYNHGVLEYGKDVIYCEETKFRKIRYSGVQVKQGDINSAMGNEIFCQISKGASPFTDLSDNNKEKDIDEFLVITSGEIKENARENISKLLKGVNFSKPLSFIEGIELINLLDDFMPKVFWEEYECFSKYFNELKKDFETIKDLSIIGHKDPIPLEGIYVSLKLTENVPGCEISNEEDLLETNKLSFSLDSKSHITLTETRQIYKQERIIDLDDALKKFDKLVIVGAPGSGKTTLLYHIALKACEENLAKNERIFTPIPIILRLFSDSGKNLREYIDNVFEYYDFPKAKDFIEKDLNDGKCVLLLDGFDELASKEKQNEVKEQIEKFVGEYPKNRFIATSRIASYNDELKDFSTLRLIEFDDDQIELFITNWFGKTTPEKTRSIIETIQNNKNIKALARNPLTPIFVSRLYSTKN